MPAFMGALWSGWIFGDSKCLDIGTMYALDYDVHQLGFCQGILKSQRCWECYGAWKGRYVNKIRVHLMLL